jgi:hypothetical protein
VHVRRDVPGAHDCSCASPLEVSDVYGPLALA